MKNPMEDLDSYERKILATLSLPGTRAEISRRLKMPRSTVEYNLNKLLKRKLIDFILKGKRKNYCLIISREKLIHTSPSPIVTMGPITLYTGREAIATLWKEIANHPIGSRLIGIQPNKSFNEAVKRSSKEMVTSVSQEITDKKFIIDAIVHEDFAKGIFSQYKDKEAKSIAKAFTGRLEDIVKVDSTFLDEKSEIFMIGKFSFFIDWFNEVAIKIENQNINHMLKSLYDATKAYGKRHEQGKYIEALINN